MEHCKVCGSHKHVCRVCGAELHRRFDDFILRAEIIYAIFMAWGYAAAAEAVIRADNWKGFPLLAISTFVLIRFFFAPTRNLHAAALLSERHKSWRWVVFTLDFPILIFHSFAYYTMCIAVRGSEENAYRFFQWFIILLSANVVWLFFIALRMHLLHRHTHYGTFIKWCVNNFVSVVLFFIASYIWSGSAASFFGLFFAKEAAFVIHAGVPLYWVFFWIALANCIADVILTASDYLGFDS
ncbi:MAG: hypothetical protein PHH75_00335 [Candidatus Omnitrophica bacterium]|nr:hypothetical protein [Candidatus Omnitrophota bacterium]MDD5573613.1 hypothetical protein [Candidatus Omnitrophota bacterium]